MNRGPVEKFGRKSENYFSVMFANATLRLEVANSGASGIKRETKKKGNSLC